MSIRRIARHLRRINLNAEAGSENSPLDAVVVDAAGPAPYLLRVSQWTLRSKQFD